METSFLFIFSSLSGDPSRGISFHQTFHFFHSHLIEVTVYGIFQCRCGKSKFQCFLVIVGICKQTVYHSSYKSISGTYTVDFVSNIVNAGIF